MSWSAEMANRLASDWKSLGSSATSSAHEVSQYAYRLRLLMVLLLVWILSPAAASARQRLSGSCEQGGAGITLGESGSSGAKSTRDFAACTVTVYVAATTRLAQIYSDSNGSTKSNPFVASPTEPWYFYADNGRYDVKFSGGGLSGPLMISNYVLLDPSDSQTGGTYFADQFPGVDPTGETDSTAGLQAAINKAESSHADLYFRPGTYRISAPLRTNRNLSAGNQSYGIAIRGVRSAWAYNSNRMPVVIKAAASWDGAHGNTSMLDFRYSSQLSISDIGIDCSGVTGLDGIELGERDGKSGVYSNFDLERNSVYGCNRGMLLQNAGLARVNSNQVTQNQTGIWFSGGDSDFDGNYINGQAVDHIAKNPYDKVGVGFYCEYCGNSNIHGGKIEWNSTGILLYSAYGINIYGINFDVDRTHHILIFSDQDGIKSPSTNQRGIAIYGNRFLAGATLQDSAQSFRRSAVVLAAVSRKGVDLRATITGNTFCRAYDLAYCEAAGGKAGPLDDVISLYAPQANGSTNTAEVTITGNDMKNGAMADAAYASGAGAVVHWGINNGNLPLVAVDGGMIRSDVGSAIVGTTVTSTVGTGTAPFSVASTTPVANLAVENCSGCLLQGASQVKPRGRFKLADQGQCTMVAGSCTGQNLGSTYNTTPLCMVTWTGTGKLTGILKVTSTHTMVTPGSSVDTDTAQVNWMCFGN